MLVDQLTLAKVVASEIVIFGSNKGINDFFSANLSIRGIQGCWANPDGASPDESE